MPPLHAPPPSPLPSLCTGMATEEVTTEASLPEQRVTTMEEHLNNINNVDAHSHNDSTSDTCNLNNDNSDTRYHARGEERLFDSLLEELFFLDDATPQLERQLASRYISAMGGPAGWLDRPAGSIVSIIIRVSACGPIVMPIFETCAIDSDSVPGIHHGRRMLPQKCVQFSFPTLITSGALFVFSSHDPMERAN